NAVAWDPTGPWWSAAPVAAMGVLAGFVACRQRREGWAFAAALTFNLAVTLFLWSDPEGWLPWWHLLLEANGLTGAVGALCWQGLRFRVYGLEADQARTPYLTRLLVVTVLGAVVLVAVPAALLIGTLDGDFTIIARIGEWPGWLTVLTVLAAVGWQC